MTEATLSAGPIEVAEEAGAYENSLRSGGEGRRGRLRWRGACPFAARPGGSRNAVAARFTICPSARSAWTCFRQATTRPTVLSKVRPAIGMRRSAKASLKMPPGGISIPCPRPRRSEATLPSIRTRWMSLSEADGELRIEPVVSGESLQNSLVGWLMREAWEAADAIELTGRFARQAVEAGIPLWRLNILLGTLNPLVSGTAYIWKRRRRRGSRKRRILHERRQSQAFLDSPLAIVYGGAGGLRRRLEGPDAVVDFPILEELKAEGATDYVAMPLHFFRRSHQCDHFRRQPARRLHDRAPGAALRGAPPS